MQIIGTYSVNEQFLTSDTDQFYNEFKNQFKKI
jgi:hypothetical protein